MMSDIVFREPQWRMTMTQKEFVPCPLCKVYVRRGLTASILIQRQAVVRHLNGEGAKETKTSFPAKPSARTFVLQSQRKTIKQRSHRKFQIPPQRQKRRQQQPSQ